MQKEMTVFEDPWVPLAAVEVSSTDSYQPRNSQRQIQDEGTGYVVVVVPHQHSYPYPYQRERMMIWEAY